MDFFYDALLHAGHFLKRHRKFYENSLQREKSFKTLLQHVKISKHRTRLIEKMCFLHGSAVTVDLMRLREILFVFQESVSSSKPSLSRKIIETSLKQSFSEETFYLMSTKKSKSNKNHEKT